jgi:hypothetical protein
MKRGTMTRASITSTHSPTLALALVTLGAAMYAGQPAVHADTITPPPPGLGTAEIEIPRGIRRVFATTVYPSYVHWLANGDGNEDTLATFLTFLLTQPVNRHEHWCYVQLYLETR